MVLLRPCVAEGQEVRVDGTNLGSGVANVSLTLGLGSGGAFILECNTTGLARSHSQLACVMPPGVGTGRALTVTVNLQASFPSGGPRAP